MLGGNGVQVEIGRMKRNEGENLQVRRNGKCKGCEVEEVKVAEHVGKLNGEAERTRSART